MVRLGVIGCGGMSDVHSKRFYKLSDRMNITAAVDIIEERAQEFAKQFSEARVATDYKEILDDVDAVFLVLPHHLHYPIAMDCLKAGKHVLLEKPLANTEEECIELINTAYLQKRVLMIAYCMRFHPIVVELKRLLDAKSFGEVFQVSIWTEQLTKYYPGHWALDPIKLGGGELFSHGCHYMDLLLWFLGNPVRGLHLGTNYGTPWMGKEGTSNVCLEFEKGKLGYYFGTWGARGTRLGYSIHAHCNEGMLEADISNGKLYFHKDKEEKLLLETEQGKHTENELAHFLDCIETGQKPLVGGCEALESLRLIWRLYEAENKNKFAALRGISLKKC